MYNEILCLRLKEERIASGYSQQQLADILSIDDSKIARIELGNQKPDPDTIGKLADFHQVSIDYLFGRAPRYKNTNDIPQSNSFQKSGVAFGA